MHIKDIKEISDILGNLFVVAEKGKKKLLQHVEKHLWSSNIIGTKNSTSIVCVLDSFRIQNTKEL